MRLRAATRGSALARWQTDHVAALLAAAHPGLEVEPVVVETTGDRRTDQPIWELGGQGVFVKEVQAAVLDGRADVAVHSAKDLPSGPAAGLVLGAVPERGDPRDALVGCTLGALAPGATVATGSVRRRAQLASLRPDLTFVGLRGNIATRLEKVPDGGAILMAVAALARLGLADRIDEALAVDVLVPQVAQGALAVECRADDGSVRALLAPIEHDASRRAVDAERSFLATLGGGCEAPVGAHAVVDERGSVVLEAMVAALDGSRILREHVQGVDAVAVGVEAGERLGLTAGALGLLDAGLRGR
ncbi:MAG: hydroxymethylbilane synthase [Acidimicrobiales bacterium]|nr:hydroxymethylbilane synthase [Acidimicrobiales bacterium]